MSETAAEYTLTAWPPSQLNAQGPFVTDSSDGSTWNLENLSDAGTDVNARRGLCPAGGGVPSPASAGQTG